MNPLAIVVMACLGHSFLQKSFQFIPSIDRLTTIMQTFRITKRLKPSWQCYIFRSLRRSNSATDSRLPAPIESCYCIVIGAHDLRSTTRTANFGFAARNQQLTDASIKCSDSPGQAARVLSKSLQPEQFNPSSNRPELFHA